MLTGSDAFGYSANAVDTVRKLTVNEGYLHVDGGNHAMQESELNFKGATITGANDAKIEPWNGTINILQSENSTVFENSIAVSLRGSNVIFNVEDGSQTDDLVIGKNRQRLCQFEYFAQEAGRHHACEERGHSYRGSDH